MALDKNAVTKNAQKFVAKGQYDKAIAEWQKLLKETPNDPNIYNTIGDLCLKKNSKTEAVDAYKRAADLLAEDGFTSKAIALYKKVLNIDINKIEVHLALGDMNAEKGLTGNALENYKHAADHYIHNKETAKALDIYQKMADLNPSNVAFQVKLGDMYAKEGMQEKSTKAYLAAADEHMGKGAFKEARQLFEKVLSLDPDNKAVYHKAGIVYFKEGKFVEAGKALKPAFENDPANAELVDIYLEALSKAGNDVEAEAVMRTLLATNPADVVAREKLYDLYLAKKDFEKAIVEAETIADKKIEDGNAEEAEMLYKTFVEGCPDYAPGRQKLAEFYIFVNRPQEAVAELLQTADLFVTEGDLQSARAVLTQAIEIAPDQSEAKEKLETLSAPGTKSPPLTGEFTTEEEPVSEIPSPVVPEPEPSSVVPEPGPSPVRKSPPRPVHTTPLAPVAAEPVAEKDDPAIIEAFAEADVLVKYGLTVKAIEQLVALTSAFPENARIHTRLVDLSLEQKDIDQAVKHALAAVALHTKYGRVDEAAALLQKTRKMAPDHPEMISRLATPPVTVEPDEPLRRAPQEVDLSEVAVEPPGEEVPDVKALDLDDLGAGSHDIPVTPSDLSPPPLEKRGIPREKAPAGEVEFEEFGSVIPPTFDEVLPAGAVPAAESPERERTLFEEASADAEAPSLAEPPAKEQLSFETDVASGLEFEEDLAGGQAQAESATVAKPTAKEPSSEVDIGELWAEAEFYFQQGLFDAAKKHYAQIITLTPGDRRAIDRLTELSREEDETREYSKLTDAVEELEGSFQAQETAEEELAISDSDREAVRSLMKEIQQVRDQPTAPPPAEEKIEAPMQRIEAEEISEPFAPSEKAVSAEENFFELGQELDLGQEPDLETTADRKAAPPVVQHEGKAPEEFFDLAAELRDELSGISVSAQPAAAEEEQSLDEIFEEFKKGIEQQTTREEADTHYNLGVAYKEMGLLDDAIGELIHTQQNEPKFVQSRYMLGLCYMEKGEYQNAAGEMQNALDASERLGTSVENRIAMHYDLGLAYQGSGDINKATTEFQKVSNENPKYQDVAAKLKELSKGDYISFEQLRDDIEKEISSKFLEEGERIEREEQTKKHDRVKNEIA